jgi:UDP-N-acetylmuramoylalanine--D-glutamate ligase
MSKQIAILGAAESGTGAAILAATRGYDVFVSDINPIKDTYKKALMPYGINWEEGRHSLSKILSASEVVKSPGIPETASVVKAIKEAGIPIISDIELAGRYTKAKKICITGSNGKTTTTLLIGHILKKAGLHVGIAGNIGSSFAWQVATMDYDIYVLEISSFQLDGMFRFMADIAVLLNITPDHLDRYEYRFEKYAESKLRIRQNQGPDQYLVYCLDDPTIRNAIINTEHGPTSIPFSIKENCGMGAWLENKTLMKFNVGSEEFDIDTNDLSIVGKHNIYNGMAGGITARLLDLRKNIIKESLSDFQNTNHRLESSGSVRGIEFINDSKATNINAAWFALETMNRPVIWIAGGQDKGNDYAHILPLVAKKVKAIVCLGKNNEKIIRAFSELGIAIIETMSAREAVKAAYLLGKPGDVVLLSPACASFDLFENYEDRGNQFKQAVCDL